MPSRNYLQHGSRHRPDGTDPIPTQASSSAWCNIGASSGWTVDHSGSINYLDIDPTDVYINDSTVFETFTYTSGSTFGGVKILAAGSYRLTVGAAWRTIQATASGETYYDPVSVGSGGNMAASFLFGRSVVKGNDVWPGPIGAQPVLPQSFFQQFLNVPGDGLSIDGSTGNISTPIELKFWAIQQTATVNGTLDYLSVLIEQLSADFYATFFGNVTQ